MVFDNATFNRYLNLVYCHQWGEQREINVRYRLNALVLLLAISITISFLDTAIYFFLLVSISFTCLCLPPTVSTIRFPQYHLPISPPFSLSTTCILLSNCITPSIWRFLLLLFLLCVAFFHYIFCLFLGNCPSVAFQCFIVIWLESKVLIGLIVSSGIAKLAHKGVL